MTYNIESLPSELIAHMLSFVSDADFVRCTSVCKRWRELRNDPHLCREHYQKITNAIIDYPEYLKISKNEPGTHLIGQLRKRTHLPSHIFPFFARLFCKLEKPPSNLHWHECDGVESVLRVNQKGDCCSYIDPSSRQPMCVYSQKKGSLFKFTPSSSQVWITDLNSSNYSSTIFSVKHSNFQTTPISYFDGKRTAVLHTGYGIYPQDFAVTIFDNSGNQTHSFPVTSCDAIVLDTNLCWVFSAGANVHIWDISTSAPFKRKSYNFSEELMELSRGSYCRDITLAEIDSHQEKLGVAFDDGSVVIIETNRILQDLYEVDPDPKKKMKKANS